MVAPTNLRTSELIKTLRIDNRSFVDVLWKLLNDNCALILLVAAPTLVWLAGLLAKNLIVKYNVALLGADILFCGLSICIAAVIRSTAAKSQIGRNPVVGAYILLGLFTAVAWFICLNVGKSAIRFADEQQSILKQTPRLPILEEKRNVRRLSLLFAGACSLSVLVGCVVYFMDISFALDTLKKTN